MLGYSTLVEQYISKSLFNISQNAIWRVFFRHASL